jgi:hypothetical protein
LPVRHRHHRHKKKKKKEKKVTKMFALRRSASSILKAAPRQQVARFSAAAVSRQGVLAIR